MVSPAPFNTCGVPATGSGTKKAQREAPEKLMMALVGPCLVMQRRSTCLELCDNEQPGRPASQASQVLPRKASRKIRASSLFSLGELKSHREPYATPMKATAHAADGDEE